MKILIAYDGSKSSDQALDDLQKAGLPASDVEILILSVAEVWMPPPISSNGDGHKKEDYPDFINELSEKRLKVAKNLVKESETLSRHARERVLSKFPSWNVKAEATYGSPGWEILNRANEFLPDLIVVGSQGKNAVSRIVLGSISQKVITEAKCSVRVARAKVDLEPLPLRIMVGFDGSVGSKEAVKSIASRDWGENAEVALLAAIHSFVPAAIGRFVTPVKDWAEDDFTAEKKWIEEQAQSSITSLESAGLKVKLRIESGNPKEVLVEQAQKWQADSIFVGAHSYSSNLERFLIGSTAAAVAERAHCSVEIVRPKPE